MRSPRAGARARRAAGGARPAPPRTAAARAASSRSPQAARAAGRRGREQRLEAADEVLVARGLPDAAERTDLARHRLHRLDGEARVEDDRDRRAPLAEDRRERLA